MSKEEKDERKELIERESTGTPSTGTVIISGEPGTTGVVELQQSSPPPITRREELVRHKTTNVGAIVALAVGAFVIVAGVYFVFSYVHFLPYPWDVVTIMAVGLILIAMGANLISSKTTAS
jgi:hypothetical protein